MGASSFSSSFIMILLGFFIVKTFANQSFEETKINPLKVEPDMSTMLYCYLFSLIVVYPIFHPEEISQSMSRILNQQKAIQDRTAEGVVEQPEKHDNPNDS